MMGMGQDPRLSIIQQMMQQQQQPGVMGQQPMGQPAPQMIQGSEMPQMPQQMGKMGGLTDFLSPGQTDQGMTDIMDMMMGG